MVVLVAAVEFDVCSVPLFIVCELDKVVVPVVDSSDVVHDD